MPRGEAKTITHNFASIVRGRVATLTNFPILGKLSYVAGILDVVFENYGLPKVVAAFLLYLVMKFAPSQISFSTL